MGLGPLRLLVRWGGVPGGGGGCGGGGGGGGGRRVQARSVKRCGRGVASERGRRGGVRCPAAWLGGFITYSVSAYLLVNRRGAWCWWRIGGEV